jgi:hypothetical protein
MVIYRYKYRPGFDWFDPKSKFPDVENYYFFSNPHERPIADYSFLEVRHLHQWREQIFRRRIGGIRPTRHFWIAPEQEHVLELLEQQLKTHHRPKWNKLTNAYNAYFKGKIQRKGSMQVFSGKKLDGGMLEADRPAPWRSASGIQGQAYKWPEYQEMIERQLQMDEKWDEDAPPSSDDETEIPNPDPPQTVFTPKPNSSWKRQHDSNTSKITKPNLMAKLDPNSSRLKLKFKLPSNQPEQTASNKRKLDDHNTENKSELAGNKQKRAKHDTESEKGQRGATNDNSEGDLSSAPPSDDDEDVSDLLDPFA